MPSLNSPSRNNVWQANDMGIKGFITRALSKIFQLRIHRLYQSPPPPPPPPLLLLLLNPPLSPPLLELPESSPLLQLQLSSAPPRLVPPIPPPVASLSPLDTEFGRYRRTQSAAKVANKRRSVLSDTRLCNVNTPCSNHINDNPNGTEKN